MKVLSRMTVHVLASKTEIIGLLSLKSCLLLLLKQILHYQIYVVEGKHQIPLKIVDIFLATFYQY